MIADDVARLRYSMTPEEVERYRWLGETVSRALEKTLIDTRLGEKESEVVGRLCQELWKDRIDPITLMSAADERISKFRHPIPTEKRIENYSWSPSMLGNGDSLCRSHVLFTLESVPENWEKSMTPTSSLTAR